MPNDKLNGFSKSINGWTYIYVHGSPKSRGIAYGYYCAKDFKEIQRMLEFLMPESYGKPWSFFIDKINDDFYDLTKTKFPELFEEMKGIVEGCVMGGCETTIQEIIAWNFYLSIPYWYSTQSDGAGVGKEGGGSSDKCSAFIATGDWTKNGNIVVAHNSFSDFIDGQYMNTILDMYPEKGHRMIMQTCPCWIWSGTDFFITSCGIVGTETTIGGFSKYALRYPIGYRIRHAMQYGNTIDEYITILLKENSGDYANSWLFGDIKSKEIVRLELGLDYHDIERTTNGYFIGFNATYNPQIRNLECNNSGFYDIRRHQGARRVQLEALMTKYKGKLNTAIAKKIIADHYDVYLKKNNPCSRSICSHYDLDAREYMSQADRPKPFSPHGALDGTVADSESIANMSFWGRFGNSCGMPFRANDFFKKHPQWDTFKGYIRDRPSKPWTLFHSQHQPKQKTMKRKNKSHRKTQRRRIMK